MLNLPKFGQRLRLGLSRHSLTLARTRRWGGTPFELLAEIALDGHEVDSPAALADKLHMLADGQALHGMPMQVLLSEELTRVWSVAPPQGAARTADLEAACALRFQALYGESLAGWELGADWHASLPFMAAAVRSGLYESIESFANGAGAFLLDVQPQVLDAWNRWCGALESDAWFALAQQGRLHLGVTEDARLVALRALNLAPDADLAWLATQVEREALRLDTSAPSCVQVCGQLPASWDDGEANGLRVRRLDGARRGLPALSAGAHLVYAGVAA